jgi:hypothetical protein
VTDNLEQMKKFSTLVLSKFSNFDQVYKKIHQHLQYSIGFVESFMKHILIVNLFGIIDVNIFFFLKTY